MFRHLSFHFTESLYAGLAYIFLNFVATVAGQEETNPRLGNTFVTFNVVQLPRLSHNSPCPGNEAEVNAPAPPKG